jgi:CRISPR-associated endonuclease/helicase Cas3
MEISSNPAELYCDFQRVVYQIAERKYTIENLAEELKSKKQVLCIVNTRKTAQELSGLAGAVHLSTTMYPEHRKAILDEIRRKLKNYEECRVISTSMIEAGVDVDFPCVYREKTGLDSIIQSGGRCNREGKNDKSTSVLTIFELDGKTYKGIDLNIAAYEHIKVNFADISSLSAIKEYFHQLFYRKGEEALGKEILDDFNNACRNAYSFPFKSTAEKFRLIPDTTEAVYVLQDRKDLLWRLRNGERSRALFRELQKYAVSLYSNDIKNLNTFERLDESVLLFNGIYDNNLGIPLTSPSGQAFIA